MTLSSKRFRDALATVPTAVSVAATTDESGVPCAVTIGSLCSLSLDPPLVLFCLARGSSSHAVFRSADRFAVTVLAEDQADVARCFAGPRAARSRVPLQLVDRLPVVPGAVAHLLCSARALAPGGDHTIIIGEVQQAVVHPRRPLLHHQREFYGLASSRAGADDTEPLGEQHGVEPVGSTEFAVQPLLVLGHRTRRQPELPGDRHCAQSLAE